MTLLQYLFDFVLVVLGTKTLRSLYFTSDLFADFRAKREDGLESARGVRWFGKKVLTCRPCATYWMGILCGLIVWVLPMLGGWEWKIPFWLLSSLVAAWIVDASTAALQPAPAPAPIPDEPPPAAVAVSHTPGAPPEFQVQAEPPIV